MKIAETKICSGRIMYIPKSIMMALDLHKGDILEWIVQFNNDKVLLVRKKAKK